MGCWGGGGGGGGGWGGGGGGWGGLGGGGVGGGGGGGGRVAPPTPPNNPPGLCLERIMLALLWDGVGGGDTTASRHGHKNPTTPPPPTNTDDLCVDVMSLSAVRHSDEGRHRDQLAHKKKKKKPTGGQEPGGGVGGGACPFLDHKVMELAEQMPIERNAARTAKERESCCENLRRAVAESIQNRPKKWVFWGGGVRRAARPIFWWGGGLRTVASPVSTTTLLDRRPGREALFRDTHVQRLIEEPNREQTKWGKQGGGCRGAVGRGGYAGGGWALGAGGHHLSATYVVGPDRVRALLRGLWMEASARRAYETRTRDVKRSQRYLYGPRKRPGPDSFRTTCSGLHGSIVGGSFFSLRARWRGAEVFNPEAIVFFPPDRRERKEETGGNRACSDARGETI